MDAKHRELPVGLILRRPPCPTHFSASAPPPSRRAFASSATFSIKTISLKASPPNRCSTSPCGNQCQQDSTHTRSLQSYCRTPQRSHQKSNMALKNPHLPPRLIQSTQCGPSRMLLYRLFLSTTLLKNIRFLKKDILGSLKASHEIKMVPEARSSPIPLPTGSLTKREKKLVRTSTTAWVWKCIPPEDRPKPPPPKPEKFVFGREVGVGLDTSHLNKRRRIARVGKVSRAVDKMKDHQQRMELFQRDEGERSRV